MTVSQELGTGQAVLTRVCVSFQGNRLAQKASRARLRNACRYIRTRGSFVQQAPGGLLKNETRFRVRYAETDQMGVVYYANYLVWMEIGRVELVRAFGVPYKEMETTEGLYLVVTAASCRYLYPARYDQEIVVETEVAGSTARRIEFAYRIRSADPDRLLAEGSTRHMWLNREWRPARLPERYHVTLGVEKDTK
jgi:acyl-CoA thioester hydrolase